MSYILDALRRADAERERDPARGIHAQPAAGLPARRTRAAPHWIWSLAGAVLVAVAAAAWWTTQRQAPAAPAVAVVIASAQSAAPVLPAPVVLPAAASVVPPPPPAIEKAPAKPVLVTAAVAPKAPPMALPAPAATAPAAAAPAAPVAAAATAPVPPAAPPGADRIHAIGELPADVQRELPKLAISGGVHSENAAQRLLIVGGQVLNEGAEVAPGVLLEQVRARSAVLKFRGFRYSVPF